MTEEQILYEHPDLEKADFAAVYQFAADAGRKSGPSANEGIKRRVRTKARLRLLTAAPGSGVAGENCKDYALKELPQPQVDFTFGLLNLKPEPSSVST